MLIGFLISTVFGVETFQVQQSRFMTMIMNVSYRAQDFDPKCHKTVAPYLNTPDTFDQFTRTLWAGNEFKVKTRVLELYQSMNRLDLLEAGMSALLDLWSNQGPWVVAAAGPIEPTCDEVITFLRFILKPNSAFNDRQEIVATAQTVKALAIANWYLGQPLAAVVPADAVAAVRQITQKDQTNFMNLITTYHSHGL